MRPEREHLDTVRATADLLDMLGHLVQELDARLPDPTAASVPQFVGGVRAELPLVERPELIQRRTR